MNTTNFGALLLLSLSFSAVACGSPDHVESSNAAVVEGKPEEPCGSSSGGSSSGAAATTSVSGEIAFESAPDATTWATHPVSVIVDVLDVTEQDAPSKRIARASLTVTDGSSIPFSVSLSSADVDETRDYTISSHVDVDGDQKISSGDWITMESFPVLTRGNGDRAAVRVRLVR
jgi:uncharacterized lipoprotein YbaY